MHFKRKRAKSGSSICDGKEAEGKWNQGVCLGRGLTCWEMMGRDMTV